MYEIAEFLKMDKIDFKPFAYEKAAQSLESLEEDVGEIYKKGGLKSLEEVPGVGKSIAEKIEEYLKKGRIKYLSDLKKKTPINMEEMVRVEGLGPKKIKVLYQKLDIKNVKDLEKAAKTHKIALLFGFGEKTEKNILEGIEFLKRSKGRFLLGEILPWVKEISEKLSTLKEVERLEVGGSLRRRKETIGDIDFLVISKEPEKVMDFFVNLPGVVKVWGKGRTKASARLKEGFDMDIRVVPPKSYGSALQYFTGSKEHNIATRRLAIEKGLKLSEYGLFKGKKMVAGWDEPGIYRLLGLPYIEPELRENQGEIEAGLEGKLPQIISLQDMKGDLHCHSNWNGGANSIKELIVAAKNLGYEYLGIADHTKFLRIENGLDEKKLGRQRQEIDGLNKNPENFKVLQGCEANILTDGTIDINDQALSKLDYAIAGIHSSFKMEKDKMTERMIRAMKNPNINIISHPTGRILKRRDEYQIDFDKVLRAAREFKVVLEINAYPERLDLSDQNIKRAKEAKVSMIINTDSHEKSQLKLMEYGVFQARRGWAEKEDIINTQSLEKLITFFK